MTVSFFRRPFLLVGFLVFCVLCIQSACLVGDQRKCQTDQDCFLPTPTCIDGLCGACNVSSDCPVGKSCNSGLCVLPSESNPAPDGQTRPDANRTEQPSEIPATSDAGEGDSPGREPGVPEPTEVMQPEPPPSEQSTERPVAEVPTERPIAERPPAEGPGEREPRESPPRELPPEAPCRTGESRACYEGPPSTAGKGACKAGTQFCYGARGWSNCIGQVLPSAEDCNGKDDNCDGSVDEDFPQKGKSCAVGRGSCRNTGVYVCNISGGFPGLRCNAKPHAATAEKCDGKDNDCDGRVDETCQCVAGMARACGSDVGECKLSTQKCSFVAWSTCPSQVQDELCDGKDNDCDGVIDNGCCAPSKPGFRWQAHSSSSFTRGITGVVYDADNKRWFTCADNKELKKWELKLPQAPNLKRTVAYGTVFSQLLVNRSGKWLIAAGADFQVYLLQNDGNYKDVMSGHTDDVLSIDVTGETKVDDDKILVASGSADKTVKLWRGDQVKLLNTLKGHTAAVHRVSFDPTGQLVASGSADRTIRLWRRDGTFLRTLKGHSGTIVGLGWGLDGKFLYSVSLDRTLRQWNPTTGSLVRIFGNIPAGQTPLDLKVSPNGAWIALLLAHGRLRLWDTRTHRMRQELIMPTAVSGAFSWSLDSHTLAVGDKQGSITLWQCP